MRSAGGMGTSLRGIRAGLQGGHDEAISPEEAPKHRDGFLLQNVRFKNHTPPVTGFGGDTGEIASSPCPHGNPAPRNDASHTTR
jgi:hypothetical protein